VFVIFDYLIVTNNELSTIVGGAAWEISGKDKESSTSFSRLLSISEKVFRDETKVRNWETAFIMNEITLRKCKYSQREYALRV
jgi:hypothetical protein